MRELDLQALEPRLLLDAAAAVTIAEGADSQGDQVKATGDGATLSGTEDSSFSLSSLSVTDSGNVDDDGNATDEYSLTLQLDSGAVFALDNDASDAGVEFTNDNSTATLAGTAQEITEQLSGLLVTPAQDSIANITVSMSLTETTDGVVDADRGSLDFVATLTPKNDAPLFLAVDEADAPRAEEAGSFTFSIASLGLDDPDLDTEEQVEEQLIIEIDSLPTSGTLTFKGSPVAVGSTFDAEQLEQLVYTHDGSDVAAEGASSVDAFSITVLDGAGESASKIVSVDLEPVNAAPEIVGEPVQFEGESTSLGLTYIDEESAHADAAENAIVTITGLGNLDDRGTLFLDVDGDGEADADEIIDSLGSDYATFSADQLELLSFAHDGDEPIVSDLPSFIIKVTDAGGGEGTDGALTNDIDSEAGIDGQQVTISILENDDDPTLTPSTVALDSTANADSIVVITTASLNAEDPDSTKAQLAYSIETTPTYGEIQLNIGTTDSPQWIELIAGTTFTQEQIDDGLVRYVQTSSAPEGTTTDTGFTFTLVDSEFKAFDEAGDAGTWGGVNTPTTGTLTFVVDNGTGGAGVDPLAEIESENTNTGLEVSEATSSSQAAPITSAELEYTVTAGAYTFPTTQIVYTVSSLPENGTLYVDGAALNAYGSFTQADIDAGLVTFLQDGSEDHDSSFDFIVTNGGDFSDTGIFTISSTPVNDAPVAEDSTVSVLEQTDDILDSDGNVVSEGNDGIVYLTEDDVQLSDADGSEDGLGGEGEVDDLWFQIAATELELSGGTLEVWNGSSWETASTDVWYSRNLLTTSADGQESSLRYVHAGGEQADQDDAANSDIIDSFGFIVRDDLNAPNNFYDTVTTDPIDTTAETGNVSNTGTVTIEVTPFNDAPVVPLSADDNTSAGNNNVLTVGEGASGDITASLLQAVDSDNTTRQSTFVIDELPVNGILTLNGKALREGSSFTQDDIDSGALSYEHDGGETRTDSFTFTVSDGPLTTEIATFSIEITPLNDSPEITSLQPDDRLVPASTALEALSLAGAFTIGDVDILDSETDPSLVDGETDNITVTLTLKDESGAAVPFSNAILTTDATVTTEATFSTVATENLTADTLVLEGTLEGVQALLDNLEVQMVLGGEAGDFNERWSVEAVVDDRLDEVTLNGGTDNEGEVAIGDDFNTATASIELWVSTVNDAPNIALPDTAGLTVTEDGGYQDIGTITVTDADSFDTDITVVLSVLNGTLQISDAGDADISGDGTASIALVGNQEELATALANVQYQPDANDNGTVELTVRATDTALSAGHAALSTEVTPVITITAVNDEPVLTSTTPVQTMDDGQPLTITGLSVADINDVGQEVFTDSQTVTVTVRGGATGETGGTLNMDAAGVTGNGTSEVTLKGTLSEINAALDDLVLTAAEVNADTSVILDVEFSDDGNGNLALANALAISTAITVNVSGTNDAPTITVGNNAPEVDEDGSLTLSALGVTLDDADDFGADNLTLTLTVVAPDIPDRGTFSNGSETIIFTGTVAELQTVLDTEVYTPADDYYGQVTLNIEFNDAGNTGQGGAQIATRDITLAVTPVNDRPLAAGTAERVTSVAEDTAAEDIAGTGLYALLVNQYDDTTDDQTDENGNTDATTETDLSYVAITGNSSDSDQGTWQVLVGTEWVDVPTDVSDSSALVVAADADIRFVPADDFNGEPGALTVRLGDNSDTDIDTSDSATDLFDLSDDANGNLGDQTGVWSSRTIAINTSITAVNDAPTTPDDSVILAAINEDDTDPAGATVADLVGDNFDDASADDQTQEAVSGGSSANALAAIAITSNPADDSEGTWQYSTDGGDSWVDVPDDVSASNALVLSTTDSVRFLPAEDFNGDPAGLTYVVADDSEGDVTSGASVNVSTFDETGIWSSVDDADTITTTVNAINDAPVLTGSTAPQAFAISVAENDGAGTGSAEVALVSGASLSDVDTVLVGDNFGGGTITVSIDAATDADVFSVDDSLDGFASATLVNGTLTVTLDSGTTAAQVSALIDSLTYQNTSDDPDTDTRAYTVVVNDGNNDGLAEIDGDSLASNTLTGYLKVVDNNDDPVAVADADSTDEGVALSTADTTSLLDNDTDLDTPTTDFTITQVNGNTGGVGTAVSGSDGGDFTVNADGTWSFDPGTDFDGLTEGESAVTTITYQVSDGEGGVSTATVSVTVNGVDDIPTLTPDTGNVTEDTNVSADDELTTSGTLDAGTGGDTGEDKFSAETVTGTYGELTVDADGNWTYSADNTQSVIQQLNLGATLTDTLTVTNADGVTQTTVSITITGVNDAPVAMADTGTTAENADLSVAAAAGVLANDTDIDTGSTSSVSQVAGSTSGIGTAVAMTGGGTVAIAADGSYVFAPGTDFDDLAVGEAATTTVAYTVRDDNGAESSNTLTITVTGAQDAPEIAVEGADSAAESLTETDASLATSGTLSVSDLDTTDTVTASVTTVTADGDTDTLDNSDLLGMLSVDEGTLVDAASNDGTLSWSFDSSSVEGEAFDHLAAGESLVLTYTVEVEDSQEGTAQQDITITINGTNDAPVIALEDGDSDSAALTESDAPLSTSGTLSVSDLDTTDEVTPSVESVASTGDTNDLTNAELLSMLSVDADAIIDDASNDGTLTWEFDSSSVGGDAFDYLAVGETLELAYTVLVTDSEGATAEQVVTITITGSNDAPQLVAGEQPENQSGNDGEAITPFIVADAFTDIDNDADLTYSAANLPDGIEIDPTTGEISGTLSPDASIGGDNDDGIYTVTLTGTDENGATVTTTFTWTVANVAPQAFDNTAELDEGVAISDTSTTTGNVLSDGDTNGDVDVDGGNDTDTLIVSAVGAGANAGTDTTAGSAVTGTYGSVTIAEDGSYTYTLDNTNADVQALAVGESLNETFTYQISDGQGGFDTALLTITTNGTNDAPVIAIEGDDAATAALDESDIALSATGTLSVSDLDTSDTVTPSVTAVASSGDTNDLTNAELLAMLSVDADAIIDGASNDGTLNWAFDSSSADAEAFDYLGEGETLVLDYTVFVTDSEGATAEQVVTITITGSNDAPVLSADPDDQPEDQSNVDGEAITPFTVADAFTDIDTTATLTYSADVLPAGLSIDSATGEISGTLTSDASQGGVEGVYTITLTATDEFGADVSTTLTWTVANVDPVAENDAAFIDEGVASSDASDVTGNVLGATGAGANDEADSDGGNDDDSLIVSGVAFGAVPAAFSSSGDSVSGNYGAVAILDDGSYTYSLDNTDEDVQALAVGQVLSETFTYQVSDGQGGFDTALLTVTINGTNDAPVIALEGDDSAAESLTETDDTLATSGTLSVSDLDTSDSVTPSVESVATTGDVDGLSDAELLGMLSVDADAIIDGVSNDGTLNWDFDSSSVAGEAFDHLAVGESLVLDYTVLVTDSQGATAEQVVSITINGTNDAPIIAIEGDDSVSAALTESDIPLNATGTLSVSDLDTSDEVTPSVASVVTTGDTNDLTDAELLDMLSVDADAIIDAASNDGTLTWTFDSSSAAGEAFDHLAVGETLELDYTVVVTDSQGATAEQVVTITITGTNDAPVLVADEQPADQSDNDGDTITPYFVADAFTDVDNDAVLSFSADNLPDGIAIDPTTGEISGTLSPDASIGGDNADGTYTVTLTATDENGATVTTTFTWTVANVAPEAYDNVADLEEGVATGDTSTTTGNVLTDAEPDTDTDGGNDSDALIVSGIGAGANAGTASAVDTDVTGTYGSITIAEDGSYTYTLDNTNADVQALAVGESLNETFTYQISDGQGGFDTALLTITINSTNDAPVIDIDADDSASASLTETDATLNASGTLSVSDVDTTDEVTPSVASVVSTGDTNGLSNAELLSMLSVDADAIIGDASTEGTLNWEFDSSSVEGEAFDHLAVGETLELDYTVLVTDSQGATAEQVVTITITGTNDAPVLVADEQPAGQSDNDGDTITPFFVADAFTDVDNDAVLSFSADNLPDGIAIDPTSGEISGTLSPDASIGGDNDDGIYTVTLTATDENGAIVTTTFTWAVANVAPEAYDNVADLEEGIATGDSSTTTGNVLTDAEPDTDTDGGNDSDALIVSGIGAGANAGTASAVDTEVTGTYGSITVAEDGSYTYTLDNTNADVQALAVGESLNETFTYQISDGQGGFDTALISITINGSNDAPVIALEGDDSAAESLTETDDTLTTSGTLSVSDLDTTDEVTPSVTAVTATGDTDGLSNAELLSMLSVDADAIIDGVSNDGTLNWTFDSSSVAGEAFDHLAVGESLVLDYTVVVTDSQGVTAEQVVSITINGSNDAPVIALEGDDSAAESLTETDDTLTTAGTLSVSDLDTTDDVTPSVTAVTATGDTDGLTNAELLGMLSVDADAIIANTENDGTLNWNFDSASVAGEAFDHLAVGESLVLDYTVVVTDSQGATAEQVVQITINGSNDAPVIALEGDDSAAESLTETDDTLTTAGTLSVSDLDTTDDVTPSVTAVTATGDTDGLTNAELLGMLSVDADAIIANTENDGTLNWNFDSSSVAGEAFDHLAVGESLVLDYTVVVTDSQGVTAEQVVTITINGSNDAPVIVLEGDDSASESLTETDATLATAGTISVSDLDTTDDVTPSVTAVTATGDTDGLSNDQLLSMLSVDADAIINGEANDGTLNWTFDSSSVEGEAFDHLAVGESLVLDYTVVVTDSQGVTAEQVVSITINGSNDAPVIALEGDDSASESLIETDAPLTTAGTLSVSDLDTTDDVTPSVTAVTATGDTDGLSNAELLSMLSVDADAIIANTENDGTLNWTFDSSSVAGEAFDHLAVGESLVLDYTVVVTDSQGVTAEQVVSITINGSNDAPVIALEGDDSANETLTETDDTLTTSGTLSVSDLDTTDDVTPSVTAVTATGDTDGLSNDQLLSMLSVDADAIIDGVSNDGTLNWTFDSSSVAGEAFDHLAVGESLVLDYTVVVTDSQGVTAEQAVSITINGSNDAPVIALEGDDSASESLTETDATLTTAGTLSVSDLDTTDDVTPSVTAVTATGDTDGLSNAELLGMLSVDADAIIDGVSNDGTLNWTFDSASVEGEAFDHLAVGESLVLDYTVVVTDSQGVTAEQVVSITINGSNDAPVIAIEGDDSANETLTETDDTLTTSGTLSVSDLDTTDDVTPSVTAVTATGDTDGLSNDQLLSMLSVDADAIIDGVSNDGTLNWTFDSS
ncbi:VCBS domain-containing protein, partial [Cobetia sp. 5-11-6-3]|uniref:VCBS domain-containing protein n=1 Tax=Cobetia sp. 5-11-6-3 TaxID=2737458 RepID=UPI00159684A9